MAATARVAVLDQTFEVPVDGPAAERSAAGPRPVPRKSEAAGDDAASRDRTIVIFDPGQRADPALAGARVVLGDAPMYRVLRRELPVPTLAEERRHLLQRAAERLARVRADPVERLVALTREEERLERALGREVNAVSSFPRVDGTSSDLYLRAEADFLRAFRDHWARVSALLEQEVRALAPTLTDLVGFRTAARLIARAGGVEPLARSSAGHVQILGSRRKPSPLRGPKHGVLYQAEGVASVPPPRRAAFVRSLAALCVIAARADAFSHRSLSAPLLARRDRALRRVAPRP